MTSTTATRPVNLTTHEVHRAQALAWIDNNGLPNVHSVEAAIRRSELAGDPFLDNPFRKALIEVAYEVAHKRGINL